MKVLLCASGYPKRGHYEGIGDSSQPSQERGKK